MMIWYFDQFIAFYISATSRGLLNFFIIRDFSEIEVPLALHSVGDLRDKQLIGISVLFGSTFRFPYKRVLLVVIFCQFNLISGELFEHEQQCLMIMSLVTRPSVCCTHIRPWKQARLLCISSASLSIRSLQTCHARILNPSLIIEWSVGTSS